MIKVSILIPVYNQEELIKKCIDSIPKRDDIEIVVVDDCSTDTTLSVTKELLTKYKHTKLIHNKNNLGVGLTRNILLQNATGEYVFFLDSDDYVNTINFNNIIDKYLTKDIIKPKRMRTNGQTYTAHVLQGWFVKKCLLDHCVVPDSNYGEDHDLYNQMIKNITPTVLDLNKTLVYYYNFPRKDSLVYQHKFKDCVICAIAKNENEYINAWCKWHFNLGFDHIYLFDNNDLSTRFVGDFLDDDIRDKVTIYDKRGIHEHAMQLKYYNQFYKNNNAFFNWCAFIDIDEFINIRDFDNIKDFVNQECFKNFDVIRLKWHLYGDDDILFRNKSEPVFESFHKHLKNKGYANQAKHMIRGQLGDRVNVCSCHYSCIDGKIKNNCLPNGKLTNNKISITDKYTDEAWVNHYMTKTLPEFVCQKYNRGDAVFDKRNIDWNYFWKVNEQTALKLAYTRHVDNPLTYWCYSTKNNAGDIYTKFLFQKLGLPLVFSDKTKATLFSTGSILQQVQNKNQFVFGCGLHNISDKYKGDLNKVFAVRGSLTKNMIDPDNKHNITLGDPGLLLSYIYKPVTKKKYKYGIIAHYTEYEAFKKFETPDCPVFMMGLKADSEKYFFELIDKINECEFIFSSSLHGIIFAHSLGIPAVHVEYKELYSKNNFKFKDYYSVLDTSYTKINLNDIKSFETLYNNLKEDDYKPSKECLESIQNNLIKSLEKLLLAIISKETTDVRKVDPIFDDFVVEQPKQKVTKKKVNYLDIFW